MVAAGVFGCWCGCYCRRRKIFGGRSQAVRQSSFCQGDLLAANIITSEMAGQRQANEIPNLLSLRGTGGGRRRGVQHGFQQEDAETRKDRIVQQTDNDASGSRMSAVSLGYLDDPFAQAFLQGAIPRRYPIINRGMKSFFDQLKLY